MKQKTLTGENQFTDPKECVGNHNLSISGTFEGTITLQRSFDGGVTWKDTDDFTAPIETYFFEPGTVKVLYRVGTKTGDYTSGSAEVIIA
jgi:hypothetical protein